MTRNWIPWSLVLASLGLVIVGWYFAFRDATPDSMLPHEDAAIVAAGDEIYQAHCAACHGPNLEGALDWQIRNPSGLMPAPPHDETGHTWHHPDAQLFVMTKYGLAALIGDGYESDMPGFEDILTDDEILSVLAFIKSTWPPQIKDHHDRVNADYADLAE